MLTVIGVFIIILIGLKIISHKPTRSIGDSGISTTNLKQSVYVVQAGDTLYSIAQAEYNNGDRWLEIAKANKISNPEKLEKGETLIIPKITTIAKIPLTITPTVPALSVTPTQAVMNSTPTPATQAPKQNIARYYGRTYSVVKGDCLWTIAQTVYGDPYRWVDIAKANNLANPDLIHPGNVFILPR
jgi:nucleoid-associated protein YgaU